MSKLIRKRFDGIPQIVKRIPFYFMLAASSISLLAVVQYLTLEHMPIWNAAAASIPNHQMVDFTNAGDGRMVAAYIDSSERFDLPNRLCVSFINTVDPTKNIDILRSISTRIAISPCGNWLASSDHEGNVFLFTPDTLSKESRLLSKLGKEVSGLVWSHDGKQMLVRTESSLLLVSIAEKIVTTLPIELSNRVVACTGADCFLASTGNKYCLFDWKTGRVIREVPIESEARSIAFSADLRYTAYFVGTTVSLFDLWEDKLLWSREYRVPWHTQNSVSFAGDNRRLAVVSTTGQNLDEYVVNIIDVASQREVCSRRFKNKVVSGVHFATDDSIWLWCSDGSILKWDWNSQVQGQKDGLLIVRQLRMPEFD